MLFSFSPFNCDSCLLEEYFVARSCVLSLLNSFDFCVYSICVILLVLKLAITFLLLLQFFGFFFNSEWILKILIPYMFSRTHSAGCPPAARPVPANHNRTSNKIPIVQPTRCTGYLKLFVFVKRSKCFGPSFRPSSGAQNCVYSNGICQTAAATCCYQGWDGTLFHLILDSIHPFRNM